MSTTTTIPNLLRISAPDLRTLLLSPQAPSTLAIIDVRDSDHAGGHIKSSMHIPSSTLDHALPSLIRTLADKQVVVFHCALSQQRGPSAALRYIRERQKRVEKGEMGGRGGVVMGVREDGQELVSEGKEGEQEVYVLDRGFVGWQELYGEDERLTEGYARDIWVDY